MREMGGVALNAGSQCPLSAGVVLKHKSDPLTPRFKILYNRDRDALACASSISGGLCAGSWGRGGTVGLGTEETGGSGNFLSKDLGSFMLCVFLFLFLSSLFLERGRGRGRERKS